MIDKKRGQCEGFSFAPGKNGKPLWCNGEGASFLDSLDVGADNGWMEIKKFADAALKVADRKIEMELGSVDNAARIKASTGFDLAGFKRILDNYGVRHTIKRHGNEKAEALRGQIAVTLDDFDLIPFITSQPDDIFHDGQNKVGRDVIVFVKLIDGIGYRYVEEIRGGNGLVATDYVRKKKGAWDS